MNMKLIIGMIAVICVAGIIILWLSPSSVEPADTQSVTATEPGFDPTPDFAQMMDIPIGATGNYTIQELRNWERTPGPLRVGLQVGHLNNRSMPEELANLERNTGAVWSNLTEAEVNSVIAELVAEELREQGVEVDILEAAVPPGYQADLFVSIHADGNPDPDINGYKFAAPRRDYSGVAYAAIESLYKNYGQATGLQVEDNVTRRMTAYYAFNWSRYEYAIHPFTPAVIAEAGFLTSPVDRAIIVEQPQRAAAGITAGILEFLQNDTIVRRPQPTPFADVSLPVTGEVVCAPVRTRWQSRLDSEYCQPAVFTPDGHPVLLGSYSSSTITVGDAFTASGTYVPVQSIPTYFWFPYDVVGVVVDESLGMVDSWYLR